MTGTAEGESSSSPTSTSPTPDEQYSDPSAKIRLQAGDVLFRVHEWNLRRQCGFFRDMSDICADDISTAPIIQCDVSPQVLRIFLMGMQGGFSLFSKTSFVFDLKLLVPCLRLANKWDCDVVRKYCESEIAGLIRALPWQGFETASREQDVDLAQRCLRAFTRDNTDRSLYTWNREFLRLNYFDGVQEDFFAELHRAVQADMVQKVKVKGNPDWKGIADEFSPRLQGNPRKRPRDAT